MEWVSSGRLQTQNFLEYHQYANRAIIINIMRSVSGIIQNILGVDVCWKVKFNQPCPLIKMAEKLDACTRLPRKLS